jgi:hypothetical protein
MKKFKCYLLSHSHLIDYSFQPQNCVQVRASTIVTVYFSVNFTVPISQYSKLGTETWNSTIVAVNTIRYSTYCTERALSHNRAFRTFCKIISNQSSWLLVVAEQSNHAKTIILRTIESQKIISRTNDLKTNENKWLENRLFQNRRFENIDLETNDFEMIDLDYPSWKSMIDWWEDEKFLWRGLIDEGDGNWGASDV